MLNRLFVLTAWEVLPVVAQTPGVSPGVALPVVTLPTVVLYGYSILMLQALFTAASNLKSAVIE